MLAFSERLDRGRFEQRVIIRFFSASQFGQEPRCALVASELVETDGRLSCDPGYGIIGRLFQRWNRFCVANAPERFHNERSGRSLWAELALKQIELPRKFGSGFGADLDQRS